MIVRTSSRSYPETRNALVQAIEGHSLTMFARIDHAAGAREVGMELADEEVLLFGSPRGGTPLMQSDSKIGIELPLRILLWREGERVMLGYKDPRELGAIYEVKEHVAVLEQLAGLLEQLVGEAAG